MEASSITIRSTVTGAIMIITGVSTVIRIKNPEITITPGAERPMGLQHRGNGRNAAYAIRRIFVYDAMKIQHR
ncbi:MAG: hypothetical protein CV087_02415, partial [Candidatus Brocadia sp. WS118]